MAGPGEKDAKMGGSEERTTERRIIASSVIPVADSTRDVASEDFLFHLYRGSELLQDNRVLEAKEELEQALTLQPRDPKGQDLLAVVYFRIGHYPRAIQIYEQLKRDNPRDSALKLNLALCYLKTGQGQAARAELEDVVRLHPLHKRAWGYLGLAYERLHDLQKALGAFERGGHTQMSRRVAEKLASRASKRTAPSAEQGAAEAEVRGAAAAAFEELDAGEIAFSLAEPVTGSNQSATWRTVEPGATPERMAPPSGDRAPSQRKGTDGWTVPPTAEAVASMRAEEIAASSDNETPIPSPPGMPGAQAVPMPLAHLTRAARLSAPASPGVLMHPSGVALVRTAGGAEGAGAHPFAARLEAVRAQCGTLASDVLPRHARGKSTGESFGGVASPLVRIAGAGELVVAPRPSYAIVPFTLAEEVVTVREDVLLGFELANITYEGGKLALGDGDSVNVVQLRGTGVVLLELLSRLQAVDVTEERPVFLRRDSLLGWTGARIAPRALPPAESPSGQRGLLRFVGDGTVLLTSN
jgi:uncharacterized protein (AIM24 family)/DNA-binding SARP family transcriptional activator